MTDDPDEIAKKVIAATVELVARTYERANAYTNIIMVGGYAGAFTIWSFTREYLPKTAMIVVALLLATSLCSFIFFEVFKMFFTFKTAMAQRELLMRGLAGIEFLKAHEQLRRDADHSIVKSLLPVWRVALVIALGGALSAIALLFYNFVAILLGCPLWPK